jgi:hypothetical protein
MSFNVETTVGSNKILGFQMFHAKLEDEIKFAVTVGGLNLTILIKHENDPSVSARGIKLKLVKEKPIMILSLVGVEAGEHDTVTFTPVPFAKNEENETRCFIQITMARPYPGYPYWLYLISFFEGGH